MPALSPYLRKALLADAVISGLACVGMIAGASLTAGPFGVPAELMVGAGLACIPFVALITLVLRAGAAPPGVITTIIAINFAWVAGSLYIAFGPSFAPSLLGKIFVLGQGAMVFVFAELQIIGLRRTDAAAR